VSKIILVDMDGPLANFEEGVIDVWKRCYPDRPCLNLNERKSWWSEKEWETLRKGYWNDALVLIETPGFFKNLSVVSRSREALEKIINAGYTVQICSTPRDGLIHTVEDKKAWLIEFFWKDIANSAIFTHDKTTVVGDYLIDDKPDIVGSKVPSWKQILWDMPFNQQTNGMPRVKSWKEVLEYFKIE